jgi:hypothetical protein
MLQCRSVATAETPVPLPVRGTVRLAALGGIDIELRDADLETKRLTFVIRGSEVTSLPRRVRLTTHFDVPVTQATLRETSPALRGTTTSAGFLATCELTRDPFSPPIPWQAILQVDLEELPRAGRIVLWNHAEAHVIYQLTPPAFIKPASSPWGIRQSRQAV